MNITFDRRTYSLDQLDSLATDYPQGKPVYTFIKAWNKGTQTFEFSTSGSTGAPEKININRQQIEASVAATAGFLNLKSGETAMICLYPKFIASIMMAARALILDLDLILEKPSSNPFRVPSKSKIDFVSLVPFQISKMIEEGKIHELKNIRNILVGGAPLSRTEFNELAQIDTNIFQTYGMTETVSHIALMPIKGIYEEGTFRCLPNINISQDEDGCLQLCGAVTNHSTLTTNDITTLIDRQTFRWLGRRDTVINSGGIKIHPETLEKVIAEFLESKQVIAQYFITSIPDMTLGNKCLLLSKGSAISNHLFSEIQTLINVQFSKHHVPKELHTVREFVTTASGKLKRQATTDLLDLA